MDWSSAGDYILAIGALGTTAFAVVDATKAFWGGVSNHGWGHISRGVKRLLGEGEKKEIGILRANWLNGVDLATQIATAKSFISSTGGLSESQVAERIEEAYQRADQAYRNAAKVWALVISVVLAVVGGALVLGTDYTAQNAGICALVGLLATPLAPIAKDLTSALSSAVKAIQFLKPDKKDGQTS